MDRIETDYLIIGAGAAGLAFADSMLAERGDVHLTLVDRRGKPGGHWTDAYPFVTLHQPSAFYGVNSLPLGSGRKDDDGLNAGLYELASGAEINAYFERVLRDRLLASGRVRWLPMSQVGDDGQVESLLSGERTPVVVRRRVVDARYWSPSIPATHRPQFQVAPGVRLLAPGLLPRLGLEDAGAVPHRFVVVGAGKTAMDALIWLLQSGAEADAIRWVVPRDSWLINRAVTQPSMEFFDAVFGAQVDLMTAAAEATSIDDLYHRLEACGYLLRIDPAHAPTMFHHATVSLREVEELRRVRDVVRLGRVQSIDEREIVLERGRVAVEPGTLFVDCTASAVEPRAPQPIFQDGRIVLQAVRIPAPTFSAALIAWVEAHVDGDREKNRLCGVVPFTHRLADYPKVLMASLWNQFQWSQDKTLRAWIRDSRLDGFGKLVAALDKDDAPRQALLARLKEQAGAAMANLPKLAAAAA